MLGTRRYNFQPPTPTLSATMHSVTDRQTDRQNHVKSRSYCVQQYDRLKPEKLRSGGVSEEKINKKITINISNDLAYKV